MNDTTRGKTGSTEGALLRTQWNRLAEQADPALRERLAGLSDEDLMNLANEAVEEVRIRSSDDSR